MRTIAKCRSGIRSLRTAFSLSAGAYAAWAFASWLRHGRVLRRSPGEGDELLDAFIPAFDVVERHHIRVAAPADVTMLAAREQDLLRLPIVSAIFRIRAFVLRATPDDRPQPRGLVAATEALGWGVLADVPDRELIMGAVTEPWKPNPTFRALSPDAFLPFSDPGFVKIAWTLRVDTIDDAHCIFRTETRAVATDLTARARFRRYWAFASPGIGLIRWLSLRPLKRDAERRA